MFEDKEKELYDFFTCVLLESGTITQEQADELVRTRDYPLGETEA